MKRRSGHVPRTSALERVSSDPIQGPDLLASEEEAKRVEAVALLTREGALLQRLRTLDREVEHENAAATELRRDAIRGELAECRQQRAARVRELEPNGQGDVASEAS